MKKIIVGILLLSIIVLSGCNKEKTNCVEFEETPIMYQAEQLGGAIMRTNFSQEVATEYQILINIIDDYEEKECLNEGGVFTQKP